MKGIKIIENNNQKEKVKKSIISDTRKQIKNQECVEMRNK